MPITGSQCASISIPSAGETTSISARLPSSPIETAVHTPIHFDLSNFCNPMDASRRHLKNLPMVSAAAMGLESPAIDDTEMSRVGKGNHPLGPQPRQRSTHGFHCNREVVRNVVPRHRQPDR